MCMIIKNFGTTEARRKSLWNFIPSVRCNLWSKSVLFHLKFHFSVLKRQKLKEKFVSLAIHFIFLKFLTIRNFRTMEKHRELQR